MSDSVAITLVGVIVMPSVVLCCNVLTALWRNRRSSCLRTFFYRCCWNEVAERMRHWEILMLQLSLPSITALPLYYLYDHRYMIEDSIPLFLNAVDGSYDKVIIFIALLYRAIALALSFFGYISMFWAIRKKANRNETIILIHGGCLLAALGAALACAVIKDFRIGTDYMIMRLFYYTTILWVPCTNIVTTFCVVASLRKRITPTNAMMTTTMARKK